MSRESVLVDVDWLESRLGDPDLVILEVDERPLVYRLGHIAGAHCLDWRVDLQDPVTRDIPSREAIARLWRRIGLTSDSTVVFYGDKSNWYAAFGLWLFRLYGARDVRLLDGGRSELAGRRSSADAGGARGERRRDDALRPRRSMRLRASWRDVVAAVSDGGQVLDVRTPAEYRGDVLTEAGLSA